MSGPELLPCPFCGGVMVQVLSDRAQQSYVSCARCGADGPLHDTEAEAIAAWNQRAHSQGWQPIETAPKDGAAIILAASHGVSVGWWEGSEPIFKWRFIDDFSLTLTECCDNESEDRVPCNGMYADAPTHWQHLPLPPEKL